MNGYPFNQSHFLFITEESIEEQSLLPDFKEFLMGEMRFSSLMKKFPKQAEALFAKTEQEARKRLAGYRQLAGKN